MSSQPARLTPGLVPVRKGEAGPVTLAPPEPTQTALATPQAQPMPEPPAPVQPPPRASPASERAQPQPAPPPLARVPAPEVLRQNLSVRLLSETVEWLRVEAFVGRVSIQQLVEDAIAVYRSTVKR
jgi:hypothetical protein